MNPSLTRLLSALALSSAVAASSIAAVDASADALFPLPEKVRQIMNQRCVMCHGEEYAGKAELREDLDLSTDDKIRETLSEMGRLKEVIAKNEMPQKAKLSYRLRRDPKTKDRLEALKTEYDVNGEKDILMAWLKDVVPTDTPDEKKKDE